MQTMRRVDHLGAQPPNMLVQVMQWAGYLRAQPPKETQIWKRICFEIWKRITVRVFKSDRVLVIVFKSGRES
jgi:hypothetical protein